MENNIITEMDEQCIDELLKYTASYSESNAENIKKLFMQKTASARKRSFDKRLLIAAVFATLAIALSGIALATTEFSFAAVFNSLFNNEEAAPYIQTGDDFTIISNEGGATVGSNNEGGATNKPNNGAGVTVEPIAAFFDTARSGVYLELQITDPTGGMLSDSMLFISDDLRIHITGIVEARRIDANTVIVDLFVLVPGANASGASDGEIAVSINTIASGITDFLEAQPTGLGVGELIGLTGIDAPVVVPGAEFIEITGVELEDGMLTISRRDSDFSVYGWGSGHLGLMKPDGEVIWSNGSVSHEDGVRGEQNRYEIGSIDPNDLTLVWYGSRAKNTITGHWEFLVSGDNALEAPPGFGGEFEGHSVEVTMGATSIQFRIYADYFNVEFPHDAQADDAVSVLLTDGTVIHPTFSSISRDGTMATFSYTMGFVNPEDIVSVTFCGVTFGR